MSTSTLISSKSLRRILAGVLISLSLSGCIFDDKAATVVVPANTDEAVTVTRDGLTIAAAANSQSDAGVTFTITKLDTLPAAIDPALDVGAASSAYEITSTATGTMSLPVQGTLTFTLPDGADPTDIPLVLYYDEAAGFYRAISTYNYDPATNTLTFSTSHFSKYVSVSKKKFKDSHGDVDTAFKPSVDGFFHHNFGAYDHPGGSAFAMASYAQWFFDTMKATKGAGLYSLYLGANPSSETDDTDVRELISRAYIQSANYWKQALTSRNKPTDTLLADRQNGALLIQAMSITKSPQVLIMADKYQDATGGPTFQHAVLVYKYDKAAGKFYVYDPNFPGEDNITLDWSWTNGFGTYSKNASFNNQAKIFVFDSLNSAFAPSDLKNLYDGIEGGWDTTRFGSIAISAPCDPSATNGACVMPDLDAAKNLTVSGTLSGITTNSTQYAHIYLNGVRQVSKDANGNPTSLTPVTLTGGAFSHPIGDITSQANVMVIVSSNPRSPWVGYAGFASFNIKIQGTTFFSNLGFETGDASSWLGAWMNKFYGSTDANGKPDGTKTYFEDLQVDANGWSATSLGPKSAIMASTDTDAIAGNQVLPVFKGNHSLRVNNSDPNDDASAVTQTATIPATGNPELRFYWAAVLEDPQHEPSHQPYVHIRAIIKTGAHAGEKIFDQFFYTGDPSYSGWLVFNAGGWQGIPWQTVVITGLSQYAGADIQLIVEATDCGYGGHGGYLYLDADD